MVFDEVTTKTAKPGDLYMLKLAQPLLAGDHVVIPRGTKAWGVVTAASGNGITGHSGKLSTKLLRIEYQGDQIPISGTPGSKGGSGSEQVILATLALTPWGLFAKGNNAKLKAGDLVYGYLVDPYPIQAAAVSPGSDIPLSPR